MDFRTIALLSLRSTFYSPLSNMASETHTVHVANGLNCLIWSRSIIVNWLMLTLTQLWHIILNVGWEADKLKVTMLVDNRAKIWSIVSYVDNCSFYLSGSYARMILPFGILIWSEITIICFQSVFLFNLWSKEMRRK